MQGTNCPGEIQAGVAQVRRFCTELTTERVPVPHGEDCMSGHTASFVPNFFQSARDAPKVMGSLLDFAKAMYLENPIPSLFKERLCVYLSRFCEGRYCITRHFGFLIGLGYPAGDPLVQAETVDQAIKLLKTPTPWQRDLNSLLLPLKAISAPIDWPEPETDLEDSLFAAATVVFVQPLRGDVERAALRNAIGAQRFEHLMGLLTFVRASHYWTMAHPDLDIDDDVRQMLDQNEELTRLLLEDPEAGRSEMAVRLFDELKLLRDLNERRELEKAKQALEERDRQRELLLRTAQAELSHVTRVTMMGELTASIAHEVLQPLAAINADAVAGRRWLASTPPNLDEAQASFDRITRAGKRAGEVIARIRALVKKSALTKAWLDLSETIQEVLAIVNIEAGHHEVSVRTELAASLPPVEGDRVQLQQVVLNLVMNGIDAMKVVTGRRQLLIKSQRHESRELLVAVQDSGIGIDEQNMGRLFEPFHTTKPEGMGMGLRISRSIIEEHGGRLWATPNAGPGTTVQFTLPISDRAAASRMNIS
jgi:signal transduction histidine kinase